MRINNYTHYSKYYFVSFEGNHGCHYQKASSAEAI